MAVNLKGRSFLTLADFTPAEIRYLLDLGHDLKAKRRAGICEPTMKGKHIVLLFEKTSTRTRCSFEVAATQEGAHVTYLDANSSQMGKKESLEDSAKVLGRFFDGIEYRGFDQKNVEDLAKYSGVPVWNGLTDADHIKGADVIYGDIWASMGEESLIPERAELLSPYRVTEEVLEATGNPNVLYMHCLPSFHDFETKLAKEWKEKGVDIREVTDEVFRGKHSVVFDEAENRMHSIKAVMVATIGK